MLSQRVQHFEYFNINNDCSMTFWFHYICSWDETIVFVYFLSLPFHFVSTDDSDRASLSYWWYVCKIYRESRTPIFAGSKLANMRKKSVLSDFVPYWLSCTICITKAVFILFI